MTWKQSKDQVDEQLKDKGISENEDIWFIDTSFPDGELNIHLCDKCGISID